MPRTPHLVRLASTVCLLCIALPCSRAAAEPSVAVVPVRLIKAPEALRKEVTKDLLSALTGLGYRVVNPETVAEQAKFQPSCTSGPCLVQTGKLLGVDSILHCSVAAHGSSYDVNLTLNETSSGTVIGQVQSRCDVCTYADVSKRVTSATAEIDRRARRWIAARAWLSLQSDPSDADVRLDRLHVGKTPIRRLVAPGIHRVVVYKAGLSARRYVSLGAGDDRELSLKLELGLTPPPTPARAERFASWWIGLGGVGLGVASAVAGSVLLGMAGNCEDDCRHTRKTAGIGFASFGGALVAAGIFALVIDNWHHSARRVRRPRQNKRRQVSFGVDPLRRTAALRLRY